MTEEPGLFGEGRPDILAGNMNRMVAAYRLRLARRAQKLGSEAQWNGRAIDITEEESVLLAEDKNRIEPYPYPGLRSFEPGEGEIFFGRDRDVDAVRKLLADNRTVAVLGGSGAGKSSLLRAGLLPYLNTKRRIHGRIGNWYRTEFRPRTQPLRELAFALAEQLIAPLLRMNADLASELGIPSDIRFDRYDAVESLGEYFHCRFADASATKNRREAVLAAFTDIAERQLDRADNIVTRGQRLAEPSLFLLVDQLEEVFRPEVAVSERNALLDLIVDLHDAAKNRKGGVYLVLTIRSEEVYRCAEHRGLSEVVIGTGYQLELLDPADARDRADLRLAIVQPARNVFEDWGLGDWLKGKDKDAIRGKRNKDAPFSQGMADLLLDAVDRLSKELDHRPDQLPLLQHALQATWHRAMKRWSSGVSRSVELEIMREDLPGYGGENGVPNLGECLNTLADDASARAAKRFADSAALSLQSGENALRATFRALARRDDIGNWARRFAGRADIEVFLDADAELAAMEKERRWTSLQTALDSFLLRNYLNQGKAGDYDISHEALVRNWRQFQLWLRDPREVAYVLGRVLREVEEPDKFDRLNDREKIELIPDTVATRVAMVTDTGQLPVIWGQDQIVAILQNSAMRKRWGDPASALQKVVQISKMADEARERKARLRILSWVSGAALGLALIAGSVYFYYHSAASEKYYEAVSRINAIVNLSKFELQRDGPGSAILLANLIKKDDPKQPETERLLLASLHQLREQRILSGPSSISGISYSPDGKVFVTADQKGNLLFRNAKNGDLIDSVRSPSDGFIFGVQWSPASNWIAIGLRDETMLLAPCSRMKLKNYFVNCSDKDSDLQQKFGGATERSGFAKFSRDGTWVVTGSFGTSIKRWDLTANPPRKSLDYNAIVPILNAFDLSSDMRVIAAGVGLGQIRLFDADSGEALKQSPISVRDKALVIAVAFNPKNPRMLAASLNNGKIYLWADWSAPESKQTPFELPGTHGNSFQIAFSKDGRYLLSASDDQIGRIWFTRQFENEQLAPGTEAEPRMLVGHNSPIWSITTSPDGEQIASGAADGRVILWNRHSALYEVPGGSGSEDQVSRASLNGESLADCIKGLTLPSNIGHATACVRSLHNRVFVAFGAETSGTILEFDADLDLTTPVDEYAVDSDVASLRIDSTTLVIESRSGRTVRRKFFDDINQLMDYSLSKLPFDGDGTHRVTLDNRVLCTLFHPSGICDAGTLAIFD